MGREGNRKVEKERRREREEERGGNTVSGWRTVSGYSHSWPRIFLFKYVFSTRLGMCSRRRWSTLFVAFLRSLLASRKCCVHHSTKKQYAERPTSEPSPAPSLSQPTLSSLWPELRHVIISTGAGTKNNYCTNLLDTSTPYTPATSFPLRILLLPLPVAFLQHHHVHPVLFFAN